MEYVRELHTTTTVGDLVELAPACLNTKHNNPLFEFDVLMYIVQWSMSMKSYEIRSIRRGKQHGAIDYCLRIYNYGLYTNCMEYGVQ